MTYLILYWFGKNGFIHVLKYFFNKIIWQSAVNGIETKLTFSCSKILHYSSLTFITVILYVYF